MEYLEVKDVAERYGVKKEVVLAHIQAGELIAINLARPTATQRPRWRISEKALADFDERRANKQRESEPKRIKKIKRKPVKKRV